MLLFLLFLMIVSGVWVIKHSKEKDTHLAIVSATMIITVFVIVAIGGMVIVIRQTNSYEEIKVIATEKIEADEAGIRLIREKLSDNPALQDKLIGFLEDEIETKKEELDKLVNLKEKKVKKYKWLVWPLR